MPRESALCSMFFIYISPEVLQPIVKHCLTIGDDKLLSNIFTMERYGKIGMRI